MRGGGRDSGVLIGGGHTALRQRRVVQAMNEIVRHTRMIGVFGVNGRKDLGGLQLVGVGLVAVPRGFVQRQGVEHLGLDVVRILARKLLHRFLIVKRARVLVDLVVVLIHLLDRREPVALALGLGTDRLAFFNGV